jgi:acylphosphatase
MNQAGVRMIVSGVVQGVGFRYYVFREATRLGINGWTRNRPDGSVEIQAEGDRGLLEELFRQIQIGPSHAHVAKVEFEPYEPSGEFDSFEIRGW